MHGYATESAAPAGEARSIAHETGQGLSTVASVCAVAASDTVNPSATSAAAQDFSINWYTVDGGGIIVAGDHAGRNLAIDDNEIMSRNAGAASVLYINHDGGDVRIGQGGGSTTVYVPVLAITGADVAEKFAISGALDAARTMAGDRNGAHRRLSR